MLTVNLNQKKFYNKIKELFQSELKELFRAKNNFGDNIGHLITKNKDILWLKDIFKNININE